MFKKILIGIITLGIVLGMGAYADSTSIDYTLECKLHSVEENTITVEDKEGNLWEYESIDIPSGLETIYLNINDNNTEDIKDDKIIAVIKK